MKYKKYMMGDNGLMYELREDDIYYPLLSPPGNEIQVNFAGKYGSIARKYLETTQPLAYSFYCRTPLLQPILNRINEEATDMLHTVVEQLREKMQPPNGNDFMDKVKYNYQIYDIAEEIVLNDIVYQPHIADSEFSTTIWMIKHFEKQKKNMSKNSESIDNIPF